MIRSNGGGAGANRNSLIVFQFATIDGSRVATAVTFVVASVGNLIFLCAALRAE